MRTRIKISLVLFLLIVSSCAQKQEQQEKIQLNGSVASAHPLATKAGMDILEKGGNAFDAAIAVAATLNVVEPMMSGMGGYGTIMIYDATTDKVRFLNASGRFPVNTDTDLMRAPTPDYMKNRVGPKSISTPGNLNAWSDMHTKYGKLDWKPLFNSAIDHAENGFTISSTTARWIGISFEDFSDYTRSFYGKDGSPLEEGDKLVQADLAKTFKLIANDGVAPFFKGDLAQAIDKRMQEVESFLSIEDLKNNKAEWWEPLTFNYKGYDVYTASLPANSFPAFVNLGIMQQFSDENLEHNSSEYLHLFAEMTKESYKSRLAYSFDPEVQKAPIDSILSPVALQAAANAIDREKASEFVAPFAKESRNTTHFVVTDKWGNTVSATQTLGNIFGSRIMVEGTGVWLNNSMAYATYEPKGNPMDAFPGRHKLSGDCPIVIMKDGKLWAALGTPGGHTITQNVPQIIFNLIDFNMKMQDAIDAPKIAFVEPDRIVVDPDMGDEIINSLREKGHLTTKRTIGNATGIKIIRDSQGNITGYDVGIDKRGEGKAAVVDH
ncbi:gamma-glutamyltransferase [Flavobacteriaceae bacterium R38]|nr:gamma-glutamyltransferase [Flavobacteriaceae bacterium R38]